MAKRKSSGSGLANFLGGVAMRAVASKMEQKYHYAERGKINPYSVAALGISTGRMKSAKDVARTGAVLGALGAFDDDAPKTSAPFPARGDLAPSGGASSSARSDFAPSGGAASPARSDLALPPAPGRRAPAPDRPAASARSAALPPWKGGGLAAPPRVGRYLYLLVRRPSDGVTQYYRAADTGVRVGDTVRIPTAAGDVEGVVQRAEWHTRADAPQMPEDTPWAL